MGVNGWAIELAGDGATHELDPATACTKHTGASRFIWVHLDGREQETLDWLREHGDLPETVGYALTAIETRPRCEAIDDGALVNLRGPGVDPETPDRLVSIRCWLEAGRAITVSIRAMAEFDRLRGQMTNGVICDPGDLISHLAVLITKQMDPTIAELGDKVDACETDLDPCKAFETRRVVAATRSDAIVYRRFVAPQRQALAALAALEVDWLQDDDRLHLREAADRFARMAEELEAVRERSALIHEQLTDLRSEQLEKRALVLSIVALIFLPLTFLTGLLGMNVDGIPFAHEPWAFWAIVGISALVAVAVTGYFMIAHWFK